MESLLRMPGRGILRFISVFAIALTLSIGLSVVLGHYLSTAPPNPFSGGATTVENRTSQGFGQPAPNLSKAELDLHIEGDRAFEATFVTPPAPVNAGLGPLFNNASCVACHVGDGRGMPTPGSLLVRVSLPPSQNQPHRDGSIFETRSGKSVAEASVSLGNAPPVPNLGTQIQDRAVFGVTPKANVEIEWKDKTGIYEDGTGYQLRSPLLNITLPNGNPLPQNVLTSLRLPPPVFGRGLLEAIPESAMVELAQAQVQRKDGISGKVNHVWDVRQKKLVVGRFGLKANNPNLFQQNAAAYINDMGVTNPLFPAENGAQEINLKTLNANTFYTQTLAVPGRTQLADPSVKKGETLFTQANCAVCHVSELKTGTHPVKAIAHQVIHPYTDLLLHDMGEGLADGRPDFEATGNEWRTPPLWGLGLTQTVLPYAGYLHDGRARTLEESILWHGGEAEQSKEIFRKMDKTDRAALLQFLNSL
jgi:CxxC motif-containing protein (DUF1111 family)